MPFNKISRYVWKSESLISSISSSGVVMRSLKKRWFSNSVLWMLSQSISRIHIGESCFHISLLMKLLIFLIWREIPLSQHFRISVGCTHFLQSIYGGNSVPLPWALHFIYYVHGDTRPIVVSLSFTSFSPKFFFITHVSF